MGPIFGGKALHVNATDGFICTSRQKWEDWNGRAARKGFLLLYHRPLKASVALSPSASLFWGGYILYVPFAFRGCPLTIEQGADGGSHGMKSSYLTRAPFALLSRANVMPFLYSNQLDNVVPVLPRWGRAREDGLAAHS